MADENSCDYSCILYSDSTDTHEMDIYLCVPVPVLVSFVLCSVHGFCVGGVGIRTLQVPHRKKNRIFIRNKEKSATI